MFYSIFLCILRGIVCKNKGIINPINPIRLIGHMRPTCMAQTALGNYKSKKVSVFVIKIGLWHTYCKWNYAII